MAKTPGNTLITRLCRRLGWNDATAAARTDALNALNEAQKRICGRHSFSFLNVRTTISLSNSSDNVVAPTAPAIDFGKSVVIERPDGAEIEFRSIDEIANEAAYTYLMVETTKPSFWTFYNTTADPPVPTLLFKPANTTGSSLSLTISYQRVIADLTDGATTSAMPEGYELSILLPEAEIEEKQLAHDVVPPERIGIHEANKGAFYDAFRTTKEEPRTDTEAAQRKQAEGI